MMSTPISARSHPAVREPPSCHWAKISRKLCRSRHPTEPGVTEASGGTSHRPVEVQFELRLGQRPASGSIRFKRMQRKRSSLAILAGTLVLGIGGSLAAFQDEVNDKPKDKKDNGQKRETLAKPLTEKEAKKKAEKLRKELMTPYKKWLDEEVVYIITDEERKVFKNLSTDEEREQFIEQFWLRRDPTPDTVENEYKEEHYRRIAYANERYASGLPR